MLTDESDERIQPVLVRAYATSTIIGTLLLIVSTVWHLDDWVVPSLVTIAGSGAALLSLIVSPHLQRRDVHGLAYALLLGIFFIASSIGIYACVAIIVDLAGGF